MSTQVDALTLLRQMIEIPSVSRSESDVSCMVADVLAGAGAEVRRFGNNIVALPANFDFELPILMLNSHLDTVKPSGEWTRNPFEALVDNGRLYGLGSNDAGASVASMTEVFMQMHEVDNLPFNIILALSVEEEVGGEGGMRLLLPSLESQGIIPDMAIVGEPTGLRPAVAERGLVVFDCLTHGVSGHAAREEGVNAIYRAMTDINAVVGIQLPRESAVLGPVKFSVTQIEAGRQHNVVPAECHWVIDSRTTDAYTNEEIVEIVRNAVGPYTRVTPRSTRVRASVINQDHPLVMAATQDGLDPMVSLTTSDMSLMHSIPSLKIGPGQSARSHTADEYVMLSELREGAELYLRLINNLRSIYNKKFKR